MAMVLDDLIVSGDWADPGGKLYAGESYVVFGKADGTAVETLFNIRRRRRFHNNRD